MTSALPYLLCSAVLILSSGVPLAAQKSDPKGHPPTAPETPLELNPEVSSRSFGLQDIDRDTYVLGNVLITLYHELGHGLVELGGLPLLGREEDAVDDFALIELVTALNNLDANDPLRTRFTAYGYATVDNWLKAAVEDGQPYTSDYFGPHALNLQRHFNTACLLYGGSTDTFGGLIETFDLPEDLSFRCRNLYFTAYDGWAFTLDTFGLFSDGPGDATPDIILNIRPADRPQHDRWATLVREWEGLDTALDLFSETYDLPNPIRVTFESCGEENAFYFPEQNTVSMCYELMSAYSRYHGRDTQAILNRRQ